LLAALALLLAGALGFLGYADRQARERRSTESSRGTSARAAVALALGQAEASLRDDLAGEAKIALDEAQRRLHDDPHADVGGALARRREGLATQLRLLRELDRIRDRLWTPLGDTFDVASARVEFPSAFRDGGIAPDSLAASPTATAERLRPWAIREQVVAGLDTWLAVEPKQPGLVEVLAIVDPDPGRDAWRAAVAAVDSDQQARTAAGLAGKDQPARFLATHGASFPPDLGAGSCSPPASASPRTSP
jgi:hypothetical protein